MVSIQTGRWIIAIFFWSAAFAFELLVTQWFLSEPTTTEAGGYILPGQVQYFRYASLMFAFIATAITIAVSWAVLWQRIFGLIALAVLGWFSYLFFGVGFATGNG